MILVKNTPNNTGVAINGDYLDFEHLYEALHNIIGDEEEFIEYENGLRVFPQRPKDWLNEGQNINK